MKWSGLISIKLTGFIYNTHFIDNHKTYKLTATPWTEFITQQSMGYNQWQLWRRVTPWVSISQSTRSILAVCGHWLNNTGLIVNVRMAPTYDKQNMWQSKYSTKCALRKLEWRLRSGFFSIFSYVNKCS